jgi:hypothetical protein
MQVTQNPDDWVHVANGIESIIKAAAIVTGGFWVLWKFVLQGEYQRRISFQVDVQFIGKHTDFWLVELIALVENKGLVSHTIRKFDFDLRQLTVKDVIQDGGEEINWQTCSPHKLKEGSWIPRGWKSTFVRPGVTNRYNYITTVPREATYVLLHALAT